MQSHYLVLGVPRKATQDVIKKAYRELAKKYHPDRNPEKTSNLFQKVQEAYDTLSDDRKRRDYDNSLVHTAHRFFSFVARTYREKNKTDEYLGSRWSQ